MPNPQSEIVTSKLPRVLIIHNRYRQPGGEDVVAADQAKLLRDKGHEVFVFEKDNREIDRYGLLRKAMLFFETADNASAAMEVAKVVREFKPDVAHIHNTLPLLSPSIYAPLKDAGVKVIQFVHNYRLLCASGTLYRNGGPCTLCVDDGLKHAVKHKCWTGSKFATLAYTRMIDRHRRSETWKHKVDLFVALNEHMRELLVSKNIVPSEKVVVQPNFLDVSRNDRVDNVGEGFVFAARLVPEKGVQTLQKAHEVLKEVPLKIIGDGPLLPQPAAPPFLGFLPREETIKHLASARALVFPSEWQEGCPSTIIEAMALGRPVIASRVAGALQLVNDGVTGFFFEPGNHAQLVECMKRLNSDVELALKMGRAAREKYLREFSPDAGYARLSELYKRLLVL